MLATLTAPTGAEAEASAVHGQGRGRPRRDDPSYKWVALSNTHDALAELLHRGRG